MTAINQEYPTAMLEQNHNKTSTVFCLNKDYSTTRLVTREKPVIENKPEDKFDTVLFLPEGEGRKGEGGLRTKGYFKKSLPDKPLISVITVVFNGEKYLEETIQSVINQTYDNVEYIIIDGGSTDGTLDIIRKYENVIDYWVSEKDGGIYDAMNKGIGLSIGQLIGIINSDDFYSDDTLILISQTFLNQKNISIIHGVNAMIDSKSKLLYYAYPRKNIKKFLTSPYNHPTMFIKSEIYKAIGLFNAKMKVAADYDFMHRTIKKGINTYYLPKVIASMRKGGISSRQPILENCAEKINSSIINKNKSIIPILLIHLAYRAVKKLLP